SSGLADEPTVIVHKRSCTAGWRLAFNEIGEADIDPSIFGIEACLQIVEECRECTHRELAAMSVERLNEATHMGSLEMVRQIDRQRESRDRSLGTLGAVKNGDRETDVVD